MKIWETREEEQPLTLRAGKDGEGYEVNEVKSKRRPGAGAPASKDVKDLKWSHAGDHGQRTGIGPMGGCGGGHTGGSGRGQECLEDCFILSSSPVSWPHRHALISPAGSSACEWVRDVSIGASFQTSCSKKRQCSVYEFEDNIRLWRKEPSSVWILKIYSEAYLHGVHNFKFKN